MLWKLSDGSYIYERVPPTPQAIRAAMMSSNTATDRYSGPQSQLIRKRHYEDRSNDVPVKMQRTGNFSCLKRMVFFIKSL